MKPISFYVASIASAAVAALALQDWSVFSQLSSPDWQGLVVLFALGLVSESLTVRFGEGSEGGTHTITFIPLLASVLLFGSAIAVVLFGVMGAVAEFVVRRKPVIKALFNTSQYVLSSAVAGWVFTSTGGPLAGPLAQPDQQVGRIAIAFLGFAVTFLFLNHAAVSVAITVSEGQPFGRVWKAIVGKSGAGILLDLLISPIALLVVLFYLELHIWGLLLAVLPLLFIRRSYWMNYRLVQANRDLLTALVKAIETRDPYTSGHSQRVASLAKRIAESLDLPPHEVKNIETAALLHDIGKIEAVYTEILRKPATLTSEERGIIESHVRKGVELLESLSSFSDEVIDAVRHHHERVDGKGYPDQLSGAQISVGGRIIKVCDAIDAMLSDRPYRSALSVQQVKDQLERYSGSQFDSEIVDVILRSELLHRHARDVPGAPGRVDQEDDSSEDLPSIPDDSSKRVGSLLEVEVRSHL